MQVVYVDPGLRNELGHHANFCRYLVTELRSRNIPVTVYANDEVLPELQTGLGAKPLFRWWTYEVFTGGNRTSDPLCGWINQFEVAWGATKEDLDRIPVMGPDDLLYVNSAMPPQLMALLAWLRQRPISKRPKVVIELNLDPGAKVKELSDGTLELIDVPDQRKDPRATWYRYVSRLFRPEEREYMKLMTFDAQTSESYRNLLSYSVAAWPVPLGAVTDCHSRAGKDFLTVSLLGQQRDEKGYNMAPTIVSALLDARPNIAMLVHNGDPEAMPAPQTVLRRMAQHSRRLIVNETTAGPVLWSKLLDASDLIICPYDPVAFATRCSAVANEAIANSIPLVVPSRTSMTDILTEFNRPGTTFDAYTSDSVVEATLKLIDNYEHYAHLAHAAAKQWERTRGAGRLVDSLIEWQPALRNRPPIQDQLLRMSGMSATAESEDRQREISLA